MSRCLQQCRCSLSLKVFVGGILLYLTISCSLMIPSVRQFSQYRQQISELEQNSPETYQCYQICNDIYHFQKEPSLCCNDALIGQCFTKTECKARRMENLKNQLQSAVFDIKMGIGITIFSLIVLTIIFKKKYAHLVRQQAQMRRNLMNIFQNDQQGNINSSFLKQRASTNVYKSFLEEIKPQQEASCAICYQSYSQERVVQLTCSHTFHSDCIRQWLAKRSDCPICRASA